MNPTETGATDVLANLSAGAVLAIALALTVLRVLLLKFSKSAPKPTTRPSGHTNDSSAALYLAEVCESLIIAGVLVFLVIRPYLVQAFYIPSESMERTLLGHDAGPSQDQSNIIYKHTVHDHIFVNKLIYRYSNPHRGDIIVFKAPAVADSEDKMNGKPQKENILIKRVIGIPGDTIQVVQIGVNDYVKRNGKVLHEYKNPKRPYSINQEMEPELNSNFQFAYPDPLVLKPGQYFVMGDNRNDSNDSRYWGTVSRWRIMGKAEVIFWPINRIRILH